MANWRDVERWSREEARNYQNAALQRYVKEYLYPFSPFYREVFDQAGVTPDQIRTVDDLRRLPTSSKQDLIPTDDDPQRFKQFILQPDPEKIRAAWPLGKKLPLLWQSWTKGKPWVKEKLRNRMIWSELGGDIPPD